MQLRMRRYKTNSRKVRYQFFYFNLRNYIEWHLKYNPPKSKKVKYREKTVHKWIVKKGENMIQRGIKGKEHLKNSQQDPNGKHTPLVLPTWTRTVDQFFSSFLIQQKADILPMLALPPLLCFLLFFSSTYFICPEYVEWVCTSTSTCSTEVNVVPCRHPFQRFWNMKGTFSQQRGRPWVPRRKSAAFHCRPTGLQRGTNWWGPFCYQRHKYRYWILVLAHHGSSVIWYMFFC